MFNNNSNAQTSGTYVTMGNRGFRQMLTKLSEAFEGRSLDYVDDVKTILKRRDLKESYFNILMEDYNEAGTLQESTAMTEDIASQIIAENNSKLRELAEHSVTQMLNEAQMSGSLKPIVGLTLPLLKLYWVKNVFKDFISTEIAKEVAFYRAVERQYVIDAQNKKHWLPEALVDDSVNLYDAARQKLQTTPITVPQAGYDLITAAGGSRQNDDEISALFFINSITYKKPKDDQPETEESVTVKTRIKAQPGTGMFRHVIMGDDGETVIDTLMGDVDFTTGMLNLASTKGKIESVTIDGALSSENHLRTLTTGWDKDNYQFVIPDTPHISTGLTVERMQNEKIIYNQDSQAKVIQQMNDILAQMKDSKIRDSLAESADRLRGTKYFAGTSFDCKPPAAIHNTTPLDWSSVELKQTLDRFGLTLSGVLQNENMAISVIGNPMDIRLLDNVTWVYGKDSEVGGCKLDYQIGLYNNQRNFRIGSTWKMPQGTVRFILTPLDETQITYKLFEFQFFISNEYSDPRNVRTPAVMACDRYLFDEVMPVQGELEIKNNMVSSSEMYS